jgi:hypothetical protein
MSGGSKSKNKGNAGERELCKILGSIFDGNFQRVPSSGALLGGKNAFRRQILSENQVRSFKGDIIPPDTMPLLVIEAKSYAQFLFHQLLTPGNCPQLDEWIKQTIESADPNDVWFVCFKVVRIGWYVAVPDINQDYIFGNYASYEGTHGKFKITDLKEFFTTNKQLVLNLTAPVGININ